MINLTRDQIVISNMLGELIVKTEMILPLEELQGLSVDVDRWRETGNNPSNMLINAYQLFIQDLISDQITTERTP